LLFLSIAGADRAEAVALARQIEESPTAKQHGLLVWLDSRGFDSTLQLRKGEDWQAQIERAIADSTAFAVYVPPAGVPFWMGIEMRLGIERVAAAEVQGRPYPFIPIVAPGRDLRTLPPTARLFQASLKPLDEGIEPIIRAALGLDSTDRAKLVDHPFLGLRAFDAERAGLFFGRELETMNLVERLRARNFVVVVSDSGAGKSSLVKAGLVPRFREGAFAERFDRRPDPAEWHAVQMRPGREPFEGLANGVRSAANAAGTPYDASTHGKWIRSSEPGQVRDALREIAPADAKLLLVIDQFEELWTLTPAELRAQFVDLLLTLAPPDDFAMRVVATMRRDYFNLCRELPKLAARLDSGPIGGRFPLGRMSDGGLRQAVMKPLALAGVPTSDAKALADVVLRDVSDQPGDLALLEMALTQSWVRRGEHGGDLLRAYESIGRVEGALAEAAEDTFANPMKHPALLSEHERPVAEALFMRLVRAGDANGATRRIVKRQELTEEGWRIAQKLATEECRRLLVIREGEDARAADGATAELAHEQLITQWARYQRWLRSSTEDHQRAEDKRRLDRLIDAAEQWRTLGRASRDLAGGSALAEFNALARARLGWLSESEFAFVQASARRAARRRRTAAATLLGVIGVLLLATTVTTHFWRQAERRAVDAEASLLWHPLECKDGVQAKELVSRVTNSRHMDGPDCAWRRRRNSAYRARIGRSFRLLARRNHLAPI